MRLQEQDPRHSAKEHADWGEAWICCCIIVLKIKKVLQLLCCSSVISLAVRCWFYPLLRPFCFAEVLRCPPSQGESGTAASLDWWWSLGVDSIRFNLASLPCAHAPAPPRCRYRAIRQQDAGWVYLSLYYQVDDSTFGNSLMTQVAWLKRSIPLTLVASCRYWQAGILFCADHSAPDWWKSSLGRDWKRCHHLHPADREWVLSFIYTNDSQQKWIFSFFLWVGD